MAVIEYDSYKQKLLAMDETFENLFKALEIEQARQELNRLELEAHEDGFWNDLERSQKTRCAPSSCKINSPLRKARFHARRSARADRHGNGDGRREPAARARRGLQ